METILNGYTIQEQGLSKPVLISLEKQHNPITITNRSLDEIDLLMDNNLLCIVEIIRQTSKRKIKVLDCAAGNKTVAARELAARNPDINVYAVDFLTERNSATENFAGVKGDVYQLPFTSNVFDLVYCHGFFYYLQKEKRYKKARLAMQEITRVLAPGGVALLSAEYDDLVKHCNRNQEFEKSTSSVILPFKNGLYRVVDPFLVDPHFTLIQKI